MNDYKSIFLNVIEETKKELSQDEKFLPLEQFLKQKFCIYSQEFVQRLEKFGCTELPDDKLILYPWVKEFAKAVSELRTYHVLTTGNAQCGKSLINTLFMVDFLVFVNQNVLWYYPTKTQVDNLVPGMFGRVVRSYIQNVEDYFEQTKNTKFNLYRKDDRQSNSAFQVRGATAYFRYASTSGKDHTTQRKGLATVGGSASSISANVLFIDERSQILPDSIGTLFRRLDAARLPGGLIREIGTPGSGLGIESVMETSDYHFYPHIVCPHCNNLIKLSPKGCLLRPLEDGKFLSPTGRPVLWFYKNNQDRVSSAFFGCSVCAEELSEGDRLSAHFRCLRTGISYANYEASLPKNIDEALAERKQITMHVSPLLRKTKYNLAEFIINTGLNTESVRDFPQQVLGEASETDTQRITKSHIKAAINRPLPDKVSEIIIAGIDQGRREDWLYICKYWIPNIKQVSPKTWRYEESKLISPIAAIESAYRQVLFCKDVRRMEIPLLLKKYKVLHGFIDNEPDITDAYEMCNFSVLNLADQKQNLPKIIVPIAIMGGSMEIEGYGINTEFFQNSMLNAWTGNSISIFDLDVNDRSPTSIARHLTAMEKSHETNMWERPGDKVDDLFMAGMFCEAAVYQWVDLVRTSTVNSIEWYNDKYRDTVNKLGNYDDKYKR